MFIVLDLDGTLTLPEHREGLALQGAVGRLPRSLPGRRTQPADHRNSPFVVRIRLRGYLGIRVEIWTGRPEFYRSATVSWLDLHDVEYDRLLMAPDDYRKPAGSTESTTNSLKGGWLSAAPRKPDLVFDDRLKCVAWWRSARDHLRRRGGAHVLMPKARVMDAEDAEIMAARNGARAKGYRTGELDYVTYEGLWRIPRAKLVELLMRREVAYDNANPEIGMGPSFAMLANGVVKRARRMK